MNACQFADRLLEDDSFYNDSEGIDYGPDDLTQRAWERYQGELGGLADYQVEIRMENAQERGDEDLARACWWELEQRREHERRVWQHDPGPPL